MTITHKVFGDAKPDATAKVYNAAISTNASKGKPKTEINLGGVLPSFLPSMAKEASYISNHSSE
jgi:hypothetical protein